LPTRWHALPTRWHALTTDLPDGDLECPVRKSHAAELEIDVPGTTTRCATSRATPAESMMNVHGLRIESHNFWRHVHNLGKRQARDEDWHAWTSDISARGVEMSRGDSESREGALTARGAKKTR